MKSSILLLLSGAALGQVPCEQLTAVTISGATIRAAESRIAGPYRQPVAGRPNARSIQAHCRVALVLQPTSDSRIGMELWMPSVGWNGKFQAVGNGGWAGAISFDAMAAALSESYATASTDTGHRSSETPGASFALGHAEKLIDFGFRAVHEMTVVSKSLIELHYGRAARLAYWNSCSNGGRQGLMEAQRYPDDYDGIVAGAPAANWTGRALQSLWVAQIMHRDEAVYIPAGKYPLIHEAALGECDGLDGVVDGVIEDPRQCRFDPRQLQCTEGDGPTCLTPAQAQAARAVYSPAINPSTQREFYPGLAAGSELGWATYGGPRPFSIGNDYARFVFGIRDWDFRTFNVATAVEDAERIDGGTTNALNPDLSGFFAHGGKLIQYHGWSDPQIPPLHSIKYYERVLAALGDKVTSSYRLFMAPGMRHCGGGPGPNEFHAMAALERWRESGIAPDSIVAAHVSNNRVDRTRPLCPYPKTAQYKGSGSTNDAVNFACVVTRNESR